MLYDAQVVHNSLGPEMVQELREEFEKQGSLGGVQAKFNYAWALIKSKDLQDQNYGLRLLAEIYRDQPDRRRECLYYIALGNYKLGNLSEARRINLAFLAKEPDNAQAKKLQKLIESRMARDGYIGLAIMGSVVTIGGFVLGALLRSKKH